MENYIRSEEEIAEAVRLLEQNKSECKRYNMFGSDNHAKIDVRIDTIKNQRSEDYVYRTYPSDNEEDEEDMNLHDLWQAGIGALEYLRGECPIENLIIQVKK
jgi:hypothetical protein